MEILKPNWKTLKRWALVEYVGMEIGKKPRPNTIPIVIPDYILCQQPLLEKLEQYLTGHQNKFQADNRPTRLMMTVKVVLYISAPDLDEAKKALSNISNVVNFTEEGVLNHK